MTVRTHLTSAELEASLDLLRSAPRDEGMLELVVRRPAERAREILAEGVLDEQDGLVGDNWLSRATSHAIAEDRHRDAMVTVMSARMIGLLADDDAGRAEAGDQLYVDLDLSHDNLPTGARLAVGADAVLEVSAKPHRGCKKFQRRFGDDVVAFVNADEGIRLRLRGLNTSVVRGGVVRPGDPVRVLR